MSARILARGLGAACVALAALGAQAGGPMAVCSGGTPLKYPGSGAVTLNYDRGTLGGRTAAQAAAIVTEAVSLWTSVATSTVALNRGADMPVDVTAGNLGSYWNNWTDSYNPIIYDTNGSIIDLLFGSGMSGQVLGVAGSASSGCQFVGGRAVINGLVTDDQLMKTVVAHEVGHLIGLDHTQLDNTQGLTPTYPSNYPLMYPIAYRDYISLHEDDAAAITALYPDANVNSVYGQVSGYLRTAGGTPVRGANVWVRSSTGATFSVVSDYLMQANGYFSMLLAPGTYTLHTEAIASSFNGGSSVGPYSESATDLSFQPPLYNGGTPMAPVTLGNGTPVTFTITAGCSTTATFRLDGTGSVGGCAPPPAQPVTVSPTGTITTTTPTYVWNAVPNAASYWLLVQNLYGVAVNMAVSPSSAGCAAGTGTCSFTPATPLTFAMWGWFVNASNAAGTSAWSAGRSFTVVGATTGVPAAPTTVSPTGTITTATPTFTWNASAGATSYWLLVQNLNGVAVNRSVSASAAGCGAGTGTCSHTVSTPLAAAAWGWFVNAANASGTSAWSASRQFTVSAPVSAVPAAPTLVSPTGTITTRTPAYVWNASAGATSYWLLVQNLNGVGVNMPVSATAAGCGSGTGTCSYTPSASLASGAWGWFVNASNASGTSPWTNSAQFTVNVTTSSIPAAPTQVAPTGTITTTTPTFTWNASSGAMSYWLLAQNLNGVAINMAISASAAGCGSGTGTCSFTPATPLSIAMWGWYVNASNANGTSPWSAGRTFTINVPSSIPAAPSQVSPTGNLTTANPTYVWNASAGATSYWLLVQNLNGVAVNRAVSASAAGCGSGTGTCSYTPGVVLASAATWGWYVNASNAYGTSAWSAGLIVRTP